MVLHEALFTSLVGQTYCFHKALSRRELELYQGGVFAFSENQICLWLVFSTLLFLNIIFYLTLLLTEKRHKQEGKEKKGTGKKRREKRGGNSGEVEEEG